MESFSLEPFSGAPEGCVIIGIRTYGAYIKYMAERFHEQRRAAGITQDPMWLAKRWFAAQIRLINKLLKEAPLNITSRYNE